MPGFKVNGIGGDRRFPDGVPATAEYYYTYLWTIDTIFGEYASDNSSAIVHAKDMTLPSFVVAKEQTIGGSLEYKFAKSVSYDDVKISWYDTVGLIDYLREWRKSVWSPIFGLAAGGSYKKDTVQRQYITNDDGDLIDDVVYVLRGSWPSTIRYGDLTYTNSDAKIVEVTVTYDYALEQKG